MKKITLLFFAMLTLLSAEAKVIKITLTDGTVKVFTSTELSAIDFNDDGTMTVTTYDGQQLPAMNADLDMIEISDEAVVTDIYPDTLSFNINVDGLPVNLHTNRPIMKMNYVYPSVDPWGDPITLSGTILIPEEIWSGTACSEGILMVNHSTKFHRDEAPTISNGELENMLLANPLYPNYIIVESDFYGFGATVRFPQAFLQGLVNARSSLDGLLAARELLDAQGFDYGALCFNIGYSSAGFDALAAQKLRDLEYADRISFDKTFSGGGPSDVREAYRQYVIIDSTAYNAVPLLLMVCTKEIQKLDDISYADVFQPYISNRIDELILSKAYSSWPVCDSIGREKKVHEILSETFCNLNSPESKRIQDILDSFSMTNDDWKPDSTQRIYLFHSRGDDYVPIKSARPMIPFFKSRGFEPSLIPGKTRLQTNFLVPNMGHLSATLIYYIQTLAAIAAWPQMYTDGKLNPVYQSILDCTSLNDPVAVLRYFDSMGIDCRTIINGIIAKIGELSGEEGGSIDPIELTMKLNEILAKVGLTMQDLAEMSYDSGIDIMQFFKSLIQYLNETPQTGDAEVMRRAMQNTTQMPSEANEQLIRQWLTDGGVRLK